MALTQVTSIGLKDGEIVNADLHSAASVALSKLASTGALGSAVTATTQSASDDSTKLATTAFVQAAVTSLIDGAPGSLNTLNELAAAINDDSSYATTLTTALATKLPLAGGTLTGTLTSNSNINTTGSISGSNLTLTHGDPKINFVDSGDNPDYQVVVNAGHFMIKDATASADRLFINASSTTITNNLNVNAGLDVTGNVDINNGTGQAHYQITQTNGNTVKFGIVSGSDIELSGSANNSMYFKTNNTERLRITGGGCVYASNFGLGTDSNWKIRPNTSNTDLAFEYSTSSSLSDNNIKAYFQGSSTDARLIFRKTETGSCGLEFRNGTTQKAYQMLDSEENLVYLAQSGVHHRFYVGGSNERFRVSADGLIRFDGPTAATHGLRFTPNGWNGYDNRMGYCGTSGADFWWSSNWNPTDGSRDHSGYATNFIKQNISNGYLAFGTGAVDTSASERLRVESNGDVAINTTDGDFGQTNGASNFAKGDPKLGVLGSVAIANFSTTTTDFSQLAFYRRHGTTAGANGRLQSTHNLGKISWNGASNDTSFPDEVVVIQAVANGGDWWSGANRRASLQFHNNNVGEMARIDSNGVFSGRPLLHREMSANQGHNCWAGNGQWKQLVNLANYSANCLFVCDAAMQYSSAYTATFWVYKTRQSQYKVIHDQDSLCHFRINGSWIEIQQNSGIDQTDTFGYQKVFQAPIAMAFGETSLS